MMSPSDLHSTLSKFGAAVYGTTERIIVVLPLVEYSELCLHIPAFANAEMTADGRHFCGLTIRAAKRAE